MIELVVGVALVALAELLLQLLALIIVLVLFLFNFLIQEHCLAVWPGGPTDIQYVRARSESDRIQITAAPC